MTYSPTEPRTVYFVRPVGERGPVKIGCSIRPEKRRQSLQVSERRPLEFAAQIPGSLRDEQRIQSLFWHDHIGGEWFNWSPILQILIDAAARGEAEIENLPPARVRRQPPGKRRPWTDEQKMAARLNREAWKGRKNG